MPRPRWGIVVAGIIVFLLVTGQILLPSFGERAIEDRLTENGGSAEVTLGSVPAFRLFFGDGERFDVRARELELDLKQSEPVLERLDGFASVDVSIADSQAGPIDLQSFELHRERSAPYSLTAHGQASASSLIDYGVDGLDIPAANSITGLAMDLLGIDTDFIVPIDFDMQLVNDDGRLRVVSGGGTVGGVPTGPLAELITNAVVIKL
jgi:hypothetical protein